MEVNSRETPSVKIFLESDTDFIQTSREEKLGDIVNLAKNSFEPILVSDDDQHIGSISIQNTIFNSRLDYKSNADSNLITSGHITPLSRTSAAIKQMINYGWLRLPVFNDKKELIGQLSAKNILKILSKNDTFLNLMVDNLKVRKPIILSDKVKIKEAFGMLKSKNISQVYITDKDNSYLGTITKIILIKAFNQEVESKFSEAPNGSQQNNIYKGEKIDRDDYSIKQFLVDKNHDLKINQSENKKNIIKKLIKSDYGNITLLDDHKFPTGVITKLDLLRAILIKDQIGDLKLKMRGFNDDIKKSQIQSIQKLLVNLSKFINKKEKINQIELSNKEAKSSEGKVNTYELMLLINTYQGSTYLAHEKNRDLLSGIDRLVEEIKIQLIKKSS